MKISGTAVLNAPVEQLWAAFNDPGVLARTIPGCHVLHQVGPDAYKMTVTMGVASIKGTYEGDVILAEQDPPGSFVLKVIGVGAPGTVGADVLFRLQESASGGTDLSYEADAVVGGAIGGVGQRMLIGMAKKMAGQFFAAVDADLAGERVRVPVSVKEPDRASVPVGAISDGRPAFDGHPAFEDRDFLFGALTGAAIALAGVAVGLAGRRR